MLLSSSVLQRRLIKTASKQIVAARMFSQSQLLVPLTPYAPVSQELLDYPLTTKAHQELQESFQAFNVQCGEELKEMNQNRITNIIERGGVEGWETAEDLAFLRKRFEFNSFEQAQHFVQRVGKWAEDKDHHPEWTVEEGGKTVSVTLTSHFAGNKVTLFDFQLAEQMNKDYKITSRTFRPYPYLSNSQWSSILIFLGLYLFIVTNVRFIRSLLRMPAGDNSQSEYIKNGRVEIARPLVIGGFQLDPAAIKSIQSDEELQAYAEQNVHDFTFHTKLYRPSGIF